MPTNNAWNNTVSDADVTLNGGTVNIATDAVAHTVTIGNNTSTTAVNIDIGTGDFTMASATGTLISQLDTGEMTRPLQPAFFACVPSNDDNVTGAGTSYQIGTNVALTEVFDQGGDFNTNGTFTAPVSGQYHLICNIRMLNIPSSDDDNIELNSSNQLFSGSFVDSFAARGEPTGTSSYTFFIEALVNMDASDTAVVNIILRNGTGDDADVNGSTSAFSCFSGYLIG